MMNEKSAYRRKMEAQLHEWEAEIDRLRAKAENAQADAALNRERQQMLDELHERRMRARRDLDLLDTRAEDAWDDLKTDIEKTWADIKNAVEKIKNRM